MLEFTENQLFEEIIRYSKSFRMFCRNFNPSVLENLKDFTTNETL